LESRITEITGSPWNDQGELRSYASPPGPAIGILLGARICEKIISFVPRR
jgi:hypothetical protein